MNKQGIKQQLTMRAFWIWMIKCRAAVRSGLTKVDLKAIYSYFMIITSIPIGGLLCIAISGLFVRIIAIFSLYSPEIFVTIKMIPLLSS